MAQPTKMHVFSTLSQGFLPVAPKKTFGEKKALKCGSHMYASALEDDFRLWAAWPQDGTNTGIILQKTDYVSTTVEFLKTKDEEILLFTAVQDEVYVQRHMEKMNADSALDFQKLAIEPPAAGAVVRKVVSAEYNDGASSEVLLAVYYDSGQKGYSITLAYWDRENDPETEETVLTAKNTSGYWYFGEDGSISFHILDQNGMTIHSYDLDSGNLTPFDLPQAARDVVWYTQNGRIQRIVLGEDRRVYRFSEAQGKENDSPYAVTLLPLFAREGSTGQICPFDGIQIQADDDCIHFWGISDGKLCHYADLEEAENSPDSLLIVEEGVESFHSCAGEDGTGNILVAYNAGNTDEEDIRMALYQLPAGGEFARQEIAADTEEESQEINCYTTEVSFTDENGGAVSCSVELKAEQETVMYVGDRRYALSSQESVTVCTDLSGKLTIRQPQEDLAGVDFYMRIEGDTQYYEIKPDSLVMDSLRTLSADNLAEVKLDDGTNLLSGTETERKQTAENVANVTQNMFGQITSGEDGMTAEDTRLDAGSRRFARRLNVEPDKLAKAAGPMNMGQFHIIFGENGTIQYEPIDSDERARELRRDFYLCTGITEENIPETCSNSIFSRIREFLRSAAKGFVKVTEMLVDKAKAAFKYVVDGIERVAEFVVKTVKEVAHCVCEVFHNICIGFKRLIQWLGVLFNWSDIKKTKQYLEELFDQQLQQWKPWITSPQRLDDIARIAAQTEQGIEGLLGSLKRTGDWNQAKKQADTDETLTQTQDQHSASDLVMQKLRASDHTKTGGLSLTLRPEQADKLDILIRNLKEISIPEALWDDFKDKIQSLCSAKGSLNDLLDILIDLLKMAAELIVDSASKIIQALWAAAADMLELLLEVLENSLEIPAITSLLKLCGITIPSVKDIGLYLIAIPATVIYKLRYHRAPVSDNDQKMEIQNDESFIKVIKGTSCCAYFVCNDIACLQDILDPAGEKKNGIGDTMSVLAILCNCIWVLTDYGSEPPETVSCGICLGCDIAGILYDGIFVCGGNIENKILCGAVEAVLAVTYFFAALTDSSAASMTFAQKIAYYLPGVHDLIMAGRFLQGEEGMAMYVIACAAAAADMIFEIWGDTQKSDAAIMLPA